MIIGQLSFGRMTVAALLELEPRHSFYFWSLLQILLSDKPSPQSTKAIIPNKTFFKQEKKMKTASLSFFASYIHLFMQGSFTTQPFLLQFFYAMSW
jgi:hypothetical protein